MVRKNSNEWKLRKLLEQNSNGGLEIAQMKAIISLINKPKWSKEKEDCIACKHDKERGWYGRVKKTIYNSPVCQTHMRCAVVTKQNPYDDSFEENYKLVFSRE